MPELPEVETIKNGLGICLNATILESKVYNFQLRYPVPHNISELIHNRQILEITRRSKYLILKLDNGFLLFHFGMTGRLNITQHYRKEQHDHLVFALDNGLIISYNDSRKFGAILWIDGVLEKHPLIKNLGVEPFSTAFNAEHLYNKCLIRKIPIKQLFMEGKAVVGVGNIYASEVLFDARIHPTRLANTITSKECKQLYQSVQAILSKAIKAGGTTIKDFRNHEGNLGYFTQQLMVYGRDGQHCLLCHSVIIKITQNNRSSYYCSKCQV